jgi:hypothetical protein
MVGDVTTKTRRHEEDLRGFSPRGFLRAFVLSWLD